MKGIKTIILKGLLHSIKDDLNYIRSVNEPQTELMENSELYRMGYSDGIYVAIKIIDEYLARLEVSDED